MLADPAQAGFLGQRFFQDRCAIDECTIAERADVLCDAVGEFLQSLPQHLVVVATERIACDISEIVSFEHGGRGALIHWQVIHACRDDAAGAGDQFGRAAAACSVSGHVFDVTVVAGRQPLFESCFGPRQIDAGNADLLKSKLMTPRDDLLVQVCRKLLYIVHLRRLGRLVMTIG